jgi:hypothetical protein
MPLSSVSNNGPACQWRSEDFGPGRRQRLYVDGVKTPFFVDSALGVLAHRTAGDEHGLYGAGMGELVTQAKTPYRIAAILGSGRNIHRLKHRAEQMAMAMPTAPPPTGEGE